MDGRFPLWLRFHFNQNTKLHQNFEIRFHILSDLTQMLFVCHYKLLLWTLTNRRWVFTNAVRRPLQTPPVNHPESSGVTQMFFVDHYKFLLWAFRILCGSSQMLFVDHCEFLLWTPRKCQWVITNVVCRPLQTPPANCPESFVGHRKWFLQPLQTLTWHSQNANENPHRTFTNCSQNM